MVGSILLKYHNPTKCDPHHRYNSWIHCHRFFIENYKKLNQDEVLDYACLHLAFYLASWGMLRGGAFLLQKDYLVHKYFIKEIVANPKYYHYFDTNNQKLTHRSIDGIDDLIKEVRRVYSKNVKPVDNESINLTDTLVSKILLGVYGNVPAYDRYFRKALTIHGINSQLNEKSLLQLVSFYQYYEKDFEHCRKVFTELDGIEYSPMKLIDMYFFQFGNEMDLDEGNNKIEEAYKIASTYKKMVETKDLTDFLTSTPKTILNKGLTERVREFITTQLDIEKEDGNEFAILKSGDIHRQLNLKYQMPTVCNAMKSIKKYHSYEIIHNTPSGYSSTLTIKYNL